MVILKGKVYIGGGYYRKDSDRTIVVVYDPLKDSCGILPPYTWEYFSMAVVNNQLVLVGGSDIKDYTNKSNNLGVWNEQLGRWIHPLPPMTTACSRPTVVTHKDRWLIVIGGQGTDGGRLSRVEILDISSKQWYHSTPMPRDQKLGCEYTLAATIGSVCYLLGGYVEIHSRFQRVVSVCLDDLITQLQVSSKPASGSFPPTPSPWQTLPDTPFEHSTPLALNGTLLAVGGFTHINTPTNTIYAYHPKSKEWIKAGELPIRQPRANCSCIVLPSGEIMVIGAHSPSCPEAQQIHLAKVSYS